MSPNGPLPDIGDSQEGCKLRQKEAVKEKQLLKGDTTLPDTPNVDQVTRSKGTRTTTGTNWHSKGGSKSKCTNCSNNSYPREQYPALNVTLFCLPERRSLQCTLLVLSVKNGSRGRRNPFRFSLFGAIMSNLMDS